eukprot:Amastigsp_a520616_11.p1 type:complete len:329 gc:universal Amastigsp_a520616_11:1101-115(-)
MGGACSSASSPEPRTPRTPRERTKVSQVVPTELQPVSLPKSPRDPDESSRTTPPLSSRAPKSPKSPKSSAVAPIPLAPLALAARQDQRAAKNEHRADDHEISLKPPSKSSNSWSAPMLQVEPASDRGSASTRAHDSSSTTVQSVFAPLPRVDEHAEIRASKHHAPPPPCPLQRSAQRRLRHLFTSLFEKFGSMAAWQKSLFAFRSEHSSPATTLPLCPRSFCDVFDRSVSVAAAIECMHSELVRLGAAHSITVSGKDSAYEAFGETLVEHTLGSLARFDISFSELDAILIIKHYRNVTTYMRLGAQDALAKRSTSASTISSTAVQRSL